MSLTTIAVTSAAIFLWGVLSARLVHADLTAPIVFVAGGGLFAAPVWSTRGPPRRR
jgi:hypothetical protein